MTKKNAIDNTEAYHFAAAARDRKLAETAIRDLFDFILIIIRDAPDPISIGDRERAEANLVDGSHGLFETLKLIGDNHGEYEALNFLICLREVASGVLFAGGLGAANTKEVTPDYESIKRIRAQLNAKRGVEKRKKEKTDVWHAYVRKEMKARRQLGSSLPPSTVLGRAILNKWKCPVRKPGERTMFEFIRKARE